METQQFGRSARTSPHARELDDMLHLGAAGGLDERPLPVYRTFRDGGKKNAFSTPCKAASSVSGWLKSPTANSMFGPLRCRTSGELRTNARTRCPIAVSCRTSSCPLFPVAPVINIMDYLRWCRQDQCVVFPN